MGTAVGALRSTVGRSALVPAMLLAACFALLAPGAVQQAAAEDVSGAGTANVLTCEAAGGEADVTTSQNANGHEFIRVQCKGGMLDGWECVHDSDGGTWNCNGSAYVPDLPGRGDPIDLGDLELLAPEAHGSIAASAQASLVAPQDEQHQDHNTSKHGKGKPGKNGKKGGKHHKR